MNLVSRKGERKEEKVKLLSPGTDPYGDEWQMLK
jgi:hypothetical protein